MIPKAEGDTTTFFEERPLSLSLPMVSEKVLGLQLCAGDGVRWVDA